ncbi:hypothetical protein EF847_07410 [Actinobacteria bacterium YIM 96077]|uniref:Uncharacterized protein n=1 Tax=Phytoactinopolyspora halophila TaxID=1981511 RepID=A0A329QLF1_9ACTN|nr:hypothetical protein [Phytoactinopolyspora halophila]AYY12557.1 hypothetical protein EF847_07410 [Actinobacteria bacterium YIM 96077]RAW12539.1 hypothetical protein DPM12_14175 [Phytoactinopolyspora halophila]
MRGTLEPRTLATADGIVAPRSIITSGQATILGQVQLPEPPKFFDFTPPITREFLSTAGWLHSSRPDVVGRTKRDVAGIGFI